MTTPEISDEDFHLALAEGSEPRVSPLRLVCSRCASTRLINPQPTLDPRWYFAHCQQCGKTRVCERV